MNEANNVHGKLFTIPSLIEIFLGSGNSVKLGKSKLPINFERVLDLVDYLGYNYLNNGKIVKHLKRNGSAMKLNGGSIIPVISRIKNNKIILQKTNAEILEMLIDFTIYHFNSTESCSFTKDSVGKTFSTYVQDNL